MPDRSKLCRALDQEGFCVLEDVGLDGMHEIAAALGEPVALPGRPLVQRLLARRSEEARKNSMSGIVGLGKFPPHTDVAHWHVPARYVVLRCVGISSTPTILFDTKAFLTRQLRQEWGRATWKVTRIASPFLCSMIFATNEAEGLRWDPCCLVPQGEMAQELYPVITSAFSAALQSGAHEVVWDSPERVVVLDNWRVLHARPAIAETTSQRELQRILVRGDVHAKII